MAVGKKLLSVFFSFTLVMGLLPYSAFADPSDSSSNSTESSSDALTSNESEFADGGVASKPDPNDSEGRMDSSGSVSGGENAEFGVDDEFANEQELSAPDYSDGKLAIWADGLDDPSDVTDVYPPDTNEIEAYANGSNLQPMTFSSEMLYFCKYESSCNYDQGLSSGDGYHAMGYFQFDNRYGLGSFLKAAYNYNPSTYSALKVIGDRYGWDVTGATRSNGAFTQLGNDLNTAWHAAYKANPTEFSNLQNGWAYIDSYNGTLGARGCLKAFGINLDNRPDCIKGLCWGMVNLFGAGGGASYINNGNYYGANWFFKNSGINDSMSDEAFVTTLCDYVVNNVAKRYPKQSIYWTGWQNRYKSEKADCLGYLSSNVFTIDASEKLPNASVDIDEGEFVIASALGSRNALQLNGSGSASSSALSINRSDMGKDQTFSFEKDPTTGLMRIRSVGSSNYLSLNVSGSKMSPNVSAKAYSADDKAQLWLVEKGADNNVVICAALNADYCLDVSGGSSSEGTKVALYAKNGTAAQKWTVYPTSPEVEAERTIPDGVYSIKLKEDESKSLDIEDGSSLNGANARVWDSNGSAAQKFIFRCGEDGFYTITNFKSGKALDVDGANLLPGANVQQWTPNGTDAQKWAVCDNGDGSYLLVSKANGLALDTDGTARGDNAQMWNLAKESSQSFVLEDAMPERTVEDGTYVVSTAVNRSQVIDISGGSASNGAKAQAYGSNMTSAQTFRFSYDESTGYYEIVNVGSGKALDATDGKVSNGTRVQQWERNGTLAQRWEVRLEGDGYSVRSAIDPSQVFDMAGGKASDGAALQLYSSNGTVAQKFFLVNTKVTNISGGRTIEDGVYELKAAGFNQSLDIANGSATSGANVRAWDTNNTAAQKFVFKYGADGFYVITNLKSGKALNAADGNLVPGTNVQQWNPDGSDSQKWMVRNNANGTYSLICKANGLILELDGSARGANARLWVQDNSRSQSFVLEDAMPERTVEDGTYVVSTAVNRSQVIDISGGSASNGAKAQAYGSNMTSAQTFRFSYDESTGYYEIVNVGSGKALDATDGKVSNGTRVQQWERNGTLAQRWEVRLEGDGYSVRSAIDPSQVFDMAGGKASDGAALQLYSSNGTVAQKFFLISCEHDDVPQCTDLGLDGWYEMVPMGSSSLCMDIAGASKDDGASVQLYARNQTLAQLFRFEYSDGFYRIVSMSSGKPIELRNGSVVEGIPAQQTTKAENGAQQFSVTKNPDGSYSFECSANALKLGAENISEGALVTGENPVNSDVCGSFLLVKRDYVIPEGLTEVFSALDSGKVLDVDAASIKNGANVQLYSRNGTAAQKWQVSHVEGRQNVYRFESANSGMFMTAQDSNVCQTPLDSDSKAQMWLLSGIDAGAFSFVNLANGKSLDVMGAKTSNGTNIQTHLYNGSVAQKFVVAKAACMSDGMYVISSRANLNQVIDVNAASSAEGANIQTYSSNDTGAQKWSLISNGDGTCRFMNAANGKVLDVANGKASAGANVQQWSWNGTAAQKWHVVYLGGGGYTLESELDRSLVLSVSSQSPSNGSNIHLAKKDGTEAQRFAFTATTYVPPMPTDRKAMQDRIWGYSSGTQWLIGVDRSTHRVGVFRGSANNWSLEYWWSCVTGAPSTPTITGFYRTTGGKRMSLSTDSRAKWCTQIWNGYFFHTILNSDAELGNSLSHGCLRMSYPSAQWIYSNIYAGTAVVIYN